ncbi:MAG: hypothetical protein JWM83_2035, partial [Candidatus Angelobacter sp.]|nr:hypothetical protein [Candidatus Angelobacter sp.]
FRDEPAAALATRSEWDLVCRWLDGVHHRGHTVVLQAEEVVLNPRLRSFVSFVVKPPSSRSRAILAIFAAPPPSLFIPCHPRSSQIGVDLPHVGLDWRRVGFAPHPTPYVHPIRPKVTQHDPRFALFWLKANG